MIVILWCSVSYTLVFVFRKTKKLHGVRWPAKGEPDAWIPGGGFPFHIPPEAIFTSLRNSYSEFLGTPVHMARNSQPALQRRVAP